MYMNVYIFKILPPSRRGRDPWGGCTRRAPSAGPFL